MKIGGGLAAVESGDLETFQPFGTLEPLKPLEPLKKTDGSSSATGLCQQLVEGGKKCDDGESGEPATLYYYFDAEERRCKLFFYKGCGGTDNRFTSRKRCTEVCLVSFFLVRVFDEFAWWVFFFFSFIISVFPNISEQILKISKNSKNF